MIPVVARRLDVFDHGVSLVDCAGKFNLTLYMRVLNAFRIPYLAVYDEDPIPEEVKPGGSKYDPAKYNEAKHAFEENRHTEGQCNREFGKTWMVAGQFEDVLGISTSHADKVGKPYAAVEHFSDESNGIPVEVHNLVSEVYTVGGSVP